jgi:hypothetical protein
MWEAPARPGGVLGKALRRWPPAEAITVSGLAKAEAEELLDWLEGNGYRVAQVACARAGFTIQFWPRRPNRHPRPPGRGSRYGP